MLNGLKAASKNYAGIVSERSGSTKAQTSEWLSAETYFDADEAIEAGFASEMAAPDDTEARAMARSALSAFQLRTKSSMINQVN